jgi:hypothetical protein
MTKKEAMKILKVDGKSLNRSIMSQKIKTHINGGLIEDSVYEYLKELEERKKISKPQWINYGSY